MKVVLIPFITNSRHVSLQYKWARLCFQKKKTNEQDYDHQKEFWEEKHAPMKAKLKHTDSTDDQEKLGI